MEIFIITTGLTERKCVSWVLGYKMDRWASSSPQNLVFFVFSSAGPTTAPPSYSFHKVCTLVPLTVLPILNCPLQIIMRFTALAVFVTSTLCAVVSATPVPQTKLYRSGGATKAIQGEELKTKDFKIENGLVQPSDKHGLSTNKDQHVLDKHSHLWSVDSKHLDNHPTLKAVHDGGKKNPGHVSIAHHGAAASPTDVHSALKALPWEHERKPEPKPKKVKRELEDWDDLD